MNKPLIALILFLPFFSLSQEVPIESIIEDIRALIKAGKLADAENLTKVFVKYLEDWDLYYPQYRMR